MTNTMANLGVLRPLGIHQFLLQSVIEDQVGYSRIALLWGFGG